MQVFLIHGMGRTRISMAGLAKALADQGFEAHRFGYSVRKESLEEIAARFSGFIEEERTRDEASMHYAVIGHSLGNIITRLAAPAMPSGFSHFLMLAPPNQTPTLARRLKKNAIFRGLAGDAGQKLASEDFYQNLPEIPECRTLILAGTKGPKSPFQGDSDGIVGVEETKLPGIPHESIHAVHTFIMNHPEVRQRIFRFLQDEMELP